MPVSTTPTTLPAPELVRTLEENINRWPVGAVGGCACVTKPRGADKNQMTVPSGHQHCAGFRADHRLGQPHMERGLGIQPSGQAVGELRVHVLNDDHGRGKVRAADGPAPWPGRQARQRRRRSRPEDRGGTAEPGATAGAGRRWASHARAIRRGWSRSSPTGRCAPSRGPGCSSTGVLTASSAPALMASKTCDEFWATFAVTTTIAQGERAIMRRVASTPSILGMIKSMRIRSGRSRRQSSTASAPSRSHPGDLMLWTCRPPRDAGLQRPAARH